MRIKILFILSITILLTACQKDELQSIKINEIKKTTSNVVTITQKETTTTKKEEKKETKKIVTKTTIKNTKPTNKVIIEENPIPDTVDENHPDYIIHKGRIDCVDETTCMDISLPIQFKYKNIINNTFYTEVISKNNKLMGYFIEYIFKENQYETTDECETIGKMISNELSDRITDYECIDKTLKITTDY